jgi:beta-N-acetylhexosaminidase
MNRFRIWMVLFLLAAGSRGFSQEPAFLQYINDPWVVSAMKKMTLREKIGQLLMVEVYPDKDSIYRKKTEEILQTYKPGGILILRGSPAKTILSINEFQKISQIPLLTAIDGESGAGYRIDSLINFSAAQCLGAVQQNELIREMGRSVGKQLRALGIVLNFAPVADINTDPENPVINSRSFGDNRDNVTSKSLAFALGMQEAGVAAVAKHFPGHGDTHADSHRALPVLELSAGRVDSMEVFPFKALIDNGITGIMIGHLKVPSIDPAGKPASLSKNVVKGYLCDRMKFKGLVVTDAMNMKGVSLPPGVAEVQALKAGNDLLVFVRKLNRVFPQIEKAVANGTLSKKDIDAKCVKILALKRWLGLQEYHPADLLEAADRLNLPGDLLLKRTLTEKALTVLKNENLLPLERLDTLKIATVAIGEDTTTAFQNMSEKYMEMDHF